MYVIACNDDLYVEKFNVAMIWDFILLILLN